MTAPPSCGPSCRANVAALDGLDAAALYSADDADGLVVDLDAGVRGAGPPAVPAPTPTRRGWS